MPVEQLPALLLAILAVGYTPGPANIYAMSCSLRHGWRKSMRMWLGLLCGFLTAAILAALAAHLMGIAFGKYVPYVRYLAAAYIIYLAYRIFKGATKEGEDAAPTFTSGFIVQLTNAKIILFDLSCYSAFVLPYSQRFIDLLPVTALLVLAGPGANLVWLLGGGLLRPLAVRYSSAVSVVFALALALCAAMMLFL